MSLLNDMMPIHPGWPDIGMRLLLTVIAGALIGINRQAGGHSAGFRTTVLVGLAACLSMIQANILLSVAGKTDQSFAVMDVLRFPLGVLTGVGFIGGGAILKRGNLVTGVTTAATMWVMTAIGLCFGGGQLLVGSIATAIVIAVLLPLKHIDTWLPHTEKGLLVIAAAGHEDIPDLQSLLRDEAAVRFTGKRRTDHEDTAFSYEMRWKTSRHSRQLESLLATIEKRYRITLFEIGDETE